jgi:diadenosine tetraphosphate (Ap4A) HIT family hydrolase
LINDNAHLAVIHGLRERNARESARENILTAKGIRLQSAVAPQVVSKAIVESVHPAGFNIFNNNGLAAGQTVFHFRFDVAPRYNDEGLKVKPLLKTYESPDQMAEYTRKICEKMQIRIKDS